MSAEALEIRPAVAGDAAAIGAIILPVIRSGDTYALPRDMSERRALEYWFADDRHTFVAATEGRVVGTYYLRANQAGGGSHVANCGYVTDPRARGRGIAAAMCRHSMSFAAQQGFLAMQFNFVVSTNTGAIRLWESLGFEVLCRLPGAFLHPASGYVDALVMYRRL